MNAAPLPCPPPSANPPPCDEDTSAQPDYVNDNVDHEPSSELDSENDAVDFDPGINRNTKAELRRLQRIMMHVAETDVMGSARASAARAWRELEVLRCAKAGKPLLLTLSAKSDAPRKTYGAPVVVADAQERDERAA